MTVFDKYKFGKHLIAAVMASTMLVSTAQAGSLDLSKYKVTIATSLGLLEPYGATPEASAVTYNWDKDMMLAIGDEGAGGNMYLKTGAQEPGSYNYNSTVTANRGPTLHDSEGVTYVGNGQYVFAEERTSKLIKLSIDPTRLMQVDSEVIRYFTLPDAAYSYSVGGTGANWGNTGLEGVSYDKITGGFFAVKQSGAQRVMFIDWDFNTANSAGTTTDLFDPASLGLLTLSDIATLSTVAAFDGTDFRGNLLILSAASQKLIEVSRTGELLSSFDLSSIFTTDINQQIRGIEGVTLDKDGNIYLVSEEGGIGSAFGSSFIKLERQQAAAVPEPATWAMLITGFAMMGSVLRRRATKLVFA